jgi:hypothetical protein
MRNVQIPYFFAARFSVAGKFSPFFAGQFLPPIAAYKPGIELVIAANVFLWLGH